MADCIFCKIVAGEIPSAKIREDEDVFVFLDIHPLRKWHCLILPKFHYQDIFDIDERILQKISSTAKHIANNVKQSLDATGVNLIHASGKDAEQSVWHFHLHLVPRHPNDWLKMNDRRETKVQKFTFDELKNIAEKIQQTI
jgi:histidine triad (HIT) family protein